MSFDDDIFDGEPNPGYITAPGGWCAPADQAPESFAFPGIPLGGIKYPTPQETPMANDNTLDQEALDAAIALRAKLDEQIKRMQQQLHQRKYPNPPAKALGDMWMVDVKFVPGGTAYRFLLCRTLKGWYTTGQAEEFSHFSTWTELVDWLRGPDVAWHGVMRQLKPTETSVMEAERNND